MALNVQLEFIETEFMARKNAEYPLGYGSSAVEDSSGAWEVPTMNFDEEEESVSHDTVRSVLQIPIDGKTRDLTALLGSNDEGRDWLVASRRLYGAMMREKPIPGAIVERASYSNMRFTATPVPFRPLQARMYSPTFGARVGSNGERDYESPVMHILQEPANACLVNLSLEVDRTITVDGELSDSIDYWQFNRGAGYNGENWNGPVIYELGQSPRNHREVREAFIGTLSPEDLDVVEGNVSFDDHVLFVARQVGYVDFSLLGRVNPTSITVKLNNS